MQHGLVLVSGAGGFLGSHMVEVLREGGYEVRATDLPGSDKGPAIAAGAQWVEADLLELEGVRRVMQGVRGVINVAGLFEFGIPWESLYAANVQVTAHMCEAALEVGVDKFVHISSAAVYGAAEQLPVIESTPAEPANDYEKTKLLSEEQVWRHQRFKGLSATVLRPAFIYGPRSREMVATIMALFALGRSRRYPWLKSLKGGALSHHVHARDVCRAAALLLRRSETIGHAYNVADSTPIRWGELTQYVADLASYSGDSIPLYGPLGKLTALVGSWMPSSKLISVNKTLGEDWRHLLEQESLETPLLPRLERGLLNYMGEDRVCDTSMIQALGFVPEFPVTLNGLRDTFDWYLHEGWLPGQADLSQN
jgi:nucleoside-diphosphate-sugar epimerase